MCASRMTTLTASRMHLAFLAVALGTSSPSDMSDYLFRFLRDGDCGFYATGQALMRQWPKESIRTIGVGCLAMPTTKRT